MLSLLLKDFKLLFGGKGSVKKNIISAISSILIFAVFLVIETFMFSMILSKIRNYNNATIPFLTLFLFFISVAMTFLDLMQAHKLFFNEKDNAQLILHPISNGQLIGSKLIFLFLSHFLTTTLLVYPLIVSYGLMVGKPPMYYYMGVFYPFLSFFFEVGVALLLVYPCKIFIDFLKKYTVVQFIVALIVMCFACMAYNTVLQWFMTLVVNNDIGALFTVESINFLAVLRRYLIPANFYADIFFSGATNKFLFCLAIFAGLFVLGTTLAVTCFHYLRSFKLSDRKRKNKVVGKLTPKWALFKKEWLLLFRDSSNIFSFTGLLMIQPFLVYVVIHSLNTVFSSGTFAYYMSAFPELIPLLDMLIVMLFSVIISAGANDFFQKEERTMRIVKTIPVPIKTQVFIKIAVPCILSFASLLVTTLTLWISGTVSFLTFAFATLLTAMLLTTFTVLSLKEQFALQRTHAQESVMTSIYAYLLPILFVVGSIVGIVGTADTGYRLPLWVAYLIGTGFFGILAVPHFINLKKKIILGFLDMEPIH